MPMSEATKQAIIFWRAQGVMNKKLARMYGVTPQAISMMLKREKQHAQKNEK